MPCDLQREGHGRRNFANAISPNVIFFAPVTFRCHERQIIVKIAKLSFRRKTSSSAAKLKQGASGPELLSGFVAELN